MSKTLVEAVNLKKYFQLGKGPFKKAAYLRAVDGVSFEVRKGETFGIVGESGCGKTTLGLMVMRLLEPTDGTVLLDGTDLFRLKGNELRQYRRKLAVVFQDPYSSLNPRMKVKDVLKRPLKIHGVTSSTETRDRIESMVKSVGLGIEHLERYPHQLSGGQQQRVAIARALILHPELVVLDEPTSSLDISVQAQIVNLLLGLQKQFELTYLFITHDILTIKHISDRIAVMYAGEFVEVSDVEEIFTNTLHPYTSSLLLSVPIPDAKAISIKKDLSTKGIVVHGEPPNLLAIPEGCRFHPRCPFAADRCRKEEPKLLERGVNHKAACHRMSEIDVSSFTRELWETVRISS